MQNLKAQARRVDKMHFARNACQRLVARQRKGTSAIRVQKTILRARDAPSRSRILRATLKTPTHRVVPPPLSTTNRGRHHRKRQFCARKNTATRPVQRRAVAIGAFEVVARARRERERTSFFLRTMCVRFALSFAFGGKMKTTICAKRKAFWLVFSLGC